MSLTPEERKQKEQEICNLTCDLATSNPHSFGDYQMIRFIDAIAKDLKLFINEKKTQITPLRCGFTFLQIKYSISETGKITARVTPKKITRERRKLKAYKRLYLAGKLPKENIINAYRSWRGNMVRYKCKRSVRNIDTLFKTLFPKWIEEAF